jgi:hypothetical protein
MEAIDGSPGASSPGDAALLGFLVRRVLVAAPAELTIFNTLRMEALVLRLVVVPLFALGAGEDDLVAGHGGSVLGVR